VTRNKGKIEETITMKDIARHARVSLGTVSNVINGNMPVRPVMRRRVMDAIRDLGYKPSLLARGLRRNKTSIIGMVIPDITNPFFPAVVRGVEDVAYQNSYRLVLCNTDNDPAKEESYLRELHSYRVAGLILIPSVNSQITSLVDTEFGDVPVICLDRQPEDWSSDSVTVDNSEGAFAATNYLIKLGHRLIAMITGSLHLTNAMARLNGFRAAMHNAKLDVDHEYVQEGRFDRQSGFEKMRILLQYRPRPTAVVCGNDLIAIGVLSALRAANLRCPQDISVVGFDDIELAELTDPSLTTVFQPGYQMGARGASLLLKRLRGSSESPQTIVLPTELKVRYSVSAPQEEPERRAAKKTRA
jgi:LacI family transcriptional regulator